MSENPQEQQDIPSNLDFEVVGVRFREAGKIYYFDPDGKDIPFGTPVIVETSVAVNTATPQSQTDLFLMTA